MNGALAYTLRLGVGILRQSRSRPPSQTRGHFLSGGLDVPAQKPGGLLCLASGGIRRRKHEIPAVNAVNTEFEPELGAG